MQATYSRMDAVNAFFARRVSGHLGNVIYLSIMAGCTATMLGAAIGVMMARAGVGQ